MTYCTFMLRAKIKLKCENFLNAEEFVQFVDVVVASLVLHHDGAFAI